MRVRDPLVSVVTGEPGEVLGAFEPGQHGLLDVVVQALLGDGDLVAATKRAVVLDRIRLMLAPQDGPLQGASAVVALGDVGHQSLRLRTATALDPATGIGEQALKPWERLPVDQRLLLGITDDLALIDPLARNGRVLQHLVDGVRLPPTWSLGPGLHRGRLPAILEPHRHRVQRLACEHLAGRLPHDLALVRVGLWPEKHAGELVIDPPVPVGKATVGASALGVELHGAQLPFAHRVCVSFGP